jgi:Na+-driven multidrug efflux pump
MIFIREPEAIQLGVDYLRILALSQLFMCIEITISGAFNGIGRTEPAAFTSIVFNLLRIPMALYFSQMTLLGLNGIWWSITISSIFKGAIVYVWFGILIKQNPKFRLDS